MKRTMAVILAGGEGERLSILSSVRAKPAVPFGGKYRIIDFSLSNCVNSDIDNVVVLTQYNPRSLNDHIGLGRPWDLDRNNGGVKMLQPYISRGRVAEWYRGTADAVLRNINVIEHDSSDTIVILAGDHIYKMDYQPFVAAHRSRRADVTIAVRRVPLADATRMGILAMDESYHVTEWQEKPKQPKSDLASMGVYVFSKRALRRWLTEERTDFGSHVIPAMIEGGARVFGYHFDGYWQDVGTIQSYWEANMALLEDAPELDLYDKDWLIHTRSEERAPARVGSTSQVHRSLISHGCVINGTVVNSVLSPGVRVEVGAVVRDSIVMFDSVIRSGAVVDRAILDKEVVVGPGSIVGEGVDLTTPNRQEPARLFTGITVVGKRAIIPRGVRIGRNVKIGGDVRTSDFATRVVRSGATVERRDDASPRRRATTTLNGDAAPAAGSGSGGATGSLRSGTVGPSPIRQSADAPSGGQRRPD
ncbi:MAG: glucose-1-phosphate adenylyltransferase subunit GlgD [Candidatus Limnocylindrales bacterium]